jgi:TolA-binding protein
MVLGKRALWALCAAASLSGCVSSGDGDKMKGDIAALRTELDELRTRNEEERQRFTETVSKAQSEIQEVSSVLERAKTFLSQNNADLGAQVHELRQDIAKTQGAVDLLKVEFDKLGKDYELFKGDVVKRFEQGGAGLPTDPDGLFQVGTEAFEGGQWRKARAAFEKFSKSFPTDKRVPRALYFVGEAYMAEELWFEASRAFGSVITAHPKSSVAGDATYRAGDALLGMGQCQNARLVYEDALGRYKRSSFRKDAQEKLKELGKRRDCK